LHGTSITFLPDDHRRLDESLGQVKRMLSSLIVRLQVERQPNQRASSEARRLNLPPLQQGQIAD
jgi:hypothetical protein